MAQGKALGLGPAEFDKIEVVRSGGPKSLEIMRDAGLRMAFGSDLLSGLYHCMEFELRAKALTHGGGGGTLPDDWTDRNDRGRGVCGPGRGLRSAQGRWGS